MKLRTSNIERTHSPREIKPSNNASSNVPSASDNGTKHEDNNNKRPLGEKE